MQRPSSEASNPEQRICPLVSATNVELYGSWNGSPCDVCSIDTLSRFVASAPAGLGTANERADHEGLVRILRMENTLVQGRTYPDVGPDVEAAEGLTCRLALRVRYRNLEVVVGVPIKRMPCQHRRYMDKVTAANGCLPGNLEVVEAEEDRHPLVVPTGEVGTVPVDLDRWTSAAVK